MTDLSGGQRDFHKLPFLALPEPEKLKRLDGLKRKFMHLQERGHNRLAFERLSLAEQYLSGSLSLVCYFNWRRDCRKVESSAAVNGRCNPVEDDIAFLIHKSESGQLLNRDGDNQHVMFVDV